MPTILICLLAIPLASAVVVALLGAAGRAPEGPPRTAAAIRWVSLLTTLVCAALAVVVAVQYGSSSRMFENEGPVASVAPEFKPQMVPGADPSAPHSTPWTVLTLGSWSAGGSSPAVQFYLGIDGLNVWLVLLTCVLLVPSVLVSWKSIDERIPEYYAWLLALETTMVGVFLAFDIIVFYVFFELTLVPLFFLIGIWGGPQRQYAARKFFIYTLAGSLFTLLGVLGVVLTLALDGPDKKLTFSIPELVRQVDRHGRALDAAVDQARSEVARAEREGAAEGDVRVGHANNALAQAERQQRHWQRVQLWVFLAMLCGFAIKVPLVPLHTWLPLAHTEAPTAGSVLLAGVLLKIGAYGLLRLSLPLAPDASLGVGVPLIGWLAVIGIVYGAFCALSQHDIKKLIAYSSVSHMGFCMLGLFALNEVGLTGGIMQMINHGLSTGALFLLVGMLYDRYHTRKMADYGGMGKRLHLLAVFFVFITLSSIGLPGLNGFVGEMLVLMGMYDFRGSEVNGRLLTTVGISGVVLGAWYMLTLVMRVFCGPVREPLHEGHAVGDLTPRELAALVPIALLCLAIGVYPRPVIDTARPDVRVVAGILARARERAALAQAEGKATESVARARTER